MIAENFELCGLGSSVKASKYPMAVNTCLCNDDVTKTVRRLAGCSIGEGHDNFLNGMVVQFDLTFTIKAWTEAERYHFFDFVSSQSTMHRIAKMDVESQCCKYVTPATIDEVNRLKDIYNRTQDPEDYLTLLYNVPVGFRLTARMTTNYRQLKTIYHQRKNHRLPEWREFCEQLKKLPYSEFITGDDNDGMDGDHD